MPNGMFPCGHRGQPPCPPQPADATAGYTTEEVLAYGLQCWNAAQQPEPDAATEGPEAEDL